MTGFQRTAATHHPGARTMPGSVYTSPQVFADEVERIFARQWNCVGRASRVAEPGAFFLAEVAGESLIVVRGADGALRAFFNVCRHRGTRICVAGEGRFARTMQCPYHAWTYALDGTLVAAPHMQDVEGFDRSAHGLHEAGVAEWEGFVFVNIAPTASPFDEAWAPMRRRLARFGLAALTPGHRADYELRANWKLVFQNYNECLHCPTIHPELDVVLPFDSGENDLVAGPFLGGYMTLREPHESATLTGRACALPLGPPVERRRAYYYSFMPNMLLSIHPDYVVYYMLRPLDVGRTLITAEWLFRADNAGAAFRPEDAVGFWERTNLQDWDIVERSHAGVASRRHTPGPYSAQESIPAAWDREYLRMMREA